MDKDTARRLVQLNNDFYRENAASFSATRASAWPGWERVLASLPAAPRSVLDVACGNLRFKHFLDKRFDSLSPEYHAVDSCSAFATGSEGVELHQVDILGLLLDDRSFPEALGIVPCELTACFGFLHHVPGAGLRRAVLDGLLDLTVPGGTVAVSFWQFARDPQAARKAAVTTEAARAWADRLEDGDFLLGWQDVPGALRYCHSFTDDEVSALADGCGKRASVVDRFRADGRTGEMNGYLVLRRR